MAKKKAPMTPERSDLLLQGSAAAWLGLSPRTLERFRVEGRGPKFCKLGKRVFYLEEDLRAYVEGSRRQSTSQAAGVA